VLLVADLAKFCGKNAPRHCYYTALTQPLVHSSQVPQQFDFNTSDGTVYVCAIVDVIAKWSCLMTINDGGPCPALSSPLGLWTPPETGTIYWSVTGAKHLERRLNGGYTSGESGGQINIKV